MKRLATAAFTFLAVLILNATAYAEPGETIYGITTNNSLIRFNSETPGTITDTVSVSGLQSGENIVGIDFRPLDNALFAVGSTSRIYTINLTSGAATAIVSTPFTSTLNGAAFGVDFNPVVDRIRVVSDLDQNIRLNPITGDTAGTDTDLDFDAGDANTGADPVVVASAYTNNSAGAAATTLFGIDSALDILVRQGSPNATPTSPNAGTLFTVGALGVDTTAELTGFDVAPQRNGRAFASLTGNANISRLYSVDLAGGAATLIGDIGTAQTVRDIAVLRGGSFDFEAANSLVTENAGTATITVRRNGSSVGSAAVTVATSDGTASAGSDYTATNTTLTFVDGDVSESFNVPLFDDLITENNETITLTLSNPTGGADLGGTGTALLTLADNDQASVSGAPIILVNAPNSIGPRRLTTAQGLRTDVSCNEACTLTATLTVSNGVRRRADLTDTIIAATGATLSQSGVTTLNLVLEAEARSALRNFRSNYVLILTISATDSSSTVTNQVLRIRVER